MTHISPQMAARLYIAHGIEVLALEPKQKRPHRTLARHGKNSATGNLATVEAWPADVNIGARCGPASGIVVLDLDREDGREVVEANFGPVEKTFTVRTGRGAHHYYRLPPDIDREVVFELCPGVDVKGEGYVVGIGSVHPSGSVYTPEPDMFDGACLYIEDCPRWLAEAMRSHVRKGAEGEAPPVEAVRKGVDLTVVDDAGGNGFSVERVIRAALGEAYIGNRNRAGFHLAMQCRDNGVSQGEARAAMLEFQGAVAQEPSRVYTKNEALDSLRAAYSRPPRDPWAGPERVEVPQGGGADAPRVGATRRPMLAFSDFIKEPPPSGYTIKNFLPHDGLAMVFGDPKAGKTLATLDAMLHVASGLPWFGLRTRRRRVLYFAGEGVSGLKRRARAWSLEHPEACPDLTFAPWPLGLGDSKAVEGAALAIKEGMKEPGEVVVVDTLNAHWAKGDENTQESMTAALSSLRALFPDCLTIVVHHSGHAESAKGRARGSSVLPGAVDVAVCVSKGKQGAPNEISIPLARDGATDLRLHFTIEGRLTGWTDDDGEILDAPIIRQAEPPQGRELTAQQRECLDRITAAIGPPSASNPAPRIALQSAKAVCRDVYSTSQKVEETIGKLVERGLLKAEAEEILLP